MCAHTHVKSSFLKTRKGKSPPSNFSMFRITDKGIAIFSVAAYLEVNDFVLVLLTHFFTLFDESTIVRLRKLVACDHFAICNFENEREIVHKHLSWMSDLS